MNVKELIEKLKVFPEDAVVGSFNPVFGEIIVVEDVQLDPKFLKPFVQVLFSQPI